MRIGSILETKFHVIMLSNLRIVQAQGRKWRQSGNNQDKYRVKTIISFNVCLIKGIDGIWRHFILKFALNNVG